MNNQILRIIDANINRAVEGIRVVEDVLRFFYNDKKNFLQLRKIRHSLVTIFKPMYNKLLISRDSIKDVGKKSKEKKYIGLKDILISNIHRIEESLRVLEELSKLIDTKKTLEIKFLRYKVYSLEKKIFTNLFLD
jgi:thiamine-phosphate pyrophosphorylase